MNRSATIGALSALLLLFLSLPLVRSAGAEGGAPPPPGVDDAGGLEIEIPKSVRREFATVVYPGYLGWLSGSGGVADTQTVFDVYLVLQFTPPHLREMYHRLYLELKGG